MTIAIESYPKFNVQSSTLWLEKNITNPKVFVARGDHSAALAFISAPFYRPDDPTFELEFIVGKKSLETFRILKFLNDLRKKQGYDKTYINSRLADLSPFVEKLGGKEIGRSWIIEG